MFAFCLTNIAFFILFPAVICDSDAKTYYVCSKNGTNNEVCGTEQIPCRELQYLLKKTDDILNRNISMGFGDYNEGKIDFLRGEIRIFNSESSDKGCLICNSNDEYCFKVDNATLSVERIAFSLGWKQSTFPVAFILNNASFSLNHTKISVYFVYESEMLSEGKPVISACLSRISIQSANISHSLVWDSYQDLSDNEICDWNHGLIELNNCTTNIHDSYFSGQFGTLFMDQGSLELNTVQFSTDYIEKNFYSRRGLRCIGDGTVSATDTYEYYGTDEKGNFFDLRKCRATGPSLTRGREPFFTPEILSVIENQSTKSNKYAMTVYFLNLLPCEVKLCVHKTNSEITKLDFDANNSSFTKIELDKDAFPAKFNISLEYPGPNNTRKYSPQQNVDFRYLNYSDDGLSKVTKMIIVIVSVVSAILLFGGITVIVTVVCVVKQSRKRKGYAGMSVFPAPNSTVMSGYPGYPVSYQGFSAIPVAQTETNHSEHTNQTQNVSNNANIEKEAILPPRVELNGSTS
ncbi:uncharacterized protein MONOS_9914 [Monocercomonoides exilis]|uniref:uncharacterized protein n=1 Tax=Monocercomonoides exilis TaxID=2049356 RepID=UPI0035599BC9|nr:hypothetical protein MONOS_9914 [Monocercomonoides exilis]|eukprot:MONOS_9914.1-p1 / transcript=MONOS_9914.1 / gene=MONOS_9914 / organism=Monocercomonoides_exilis_PA203 / gene_product=unspecified product / transcript_product=unspecified product / location=Mono_scaffold00426:49256-50809(+) / protein_length=518 / sequence_SO=supercontig / SO=protein_coding / is_pseudo=false